MKKVLLDVKTNFIPVFMIMVILSMIAILPNSVSAFNNNNGRNLPFCDTLQIPSWDPCGVWYEWCGRRWFVPGTGCEKSEKNASQLHRTFYEKKNRQEQLEKTYHSALDRMNKNFSQRKVTKSRRSSDFEITFEDMQKIYSYNSDFIEYYVIPENVTMDMGFEDPYFTTPQHWTIPNDLEFSTLQRKILDPKLTPKNDSVLEATHCIYVSSPNLGINVYEYYLLDEEGLWYEGLNMEELDYDDYIEEEILPLPLSINTAYSSNYSEDTTDEIQGDTTWYSDTIYDLDIWYYWSEAYGTLETPDDGPVEVIKITYQWIWTEWEMDEEYKEENGTDWLLDYDNGTEIYFYSKEGHQLMLIIDSLGAETTGLVKPDLIYYQKVRNPTSVNEATSVVSHDFHVFPNPTNGMIYFKQPTNFDLFDMLGRRILFKRNTTQANLSHLPRGMYLIKPQDGLSKKLLITK